MTEMAPAERVLCALRRQEPDRIPHFEWIIDHRVRDAICMGDFICRWYGTTCFAVSYGGVDLVSDPPPLPSEPSALFVGRLAEDTSIMLYLEALVTLRQEHRRRLRLTVVGDGPLRPIARRYAEAQGLQVEFLGTVSDISPLFAGTQFAFVSGYLAMWQALAQKRLVFAVYENELKRDYLLGFPDAENIVVIAGDPVDLAAELNRHLAHPGLGVERRERGARLAAESSWERVADVYLAMYRAHGIA